MIKEMKLEYQIFRYYFKVMFSIFYSWLSFQYYFMVKFSKPWISLTVQLI